MARGRPWPGHGSQRRAAARSPTPAMPAARRPPAEPTTRRLVHHPRLRARHGGRVLLTETGQWARRAEPGRPIGAPLGPGGGRPRDGAGRAPQPPAPPPSRPRGRVLCAPRRSPRRRWRLLLSPSREVGGLRTAVPGDSGRGARRVHPAPVLSPSSTSSRPCLHLRSSRP